MSYLTQFMIGSTFNSVQSVTTDSGVAVPTAGGNLNILGGNVVTTSGAGNTVTVELTQGTDGQLIIGATGLDPAWASITSSDGSIIITPGANTLDLQADVVEDLDFVTDTGTATPAANVINILGGTGIDTQGVADQVTINVDVDVATQYSADSGSAVPAANNLNVIGANVVTTSGAGDTLTVQLTQGTDGQVIIGATGLDPSWATMTSAGGTIVFTPGANTLNLEASASVAISFVTDTGTATPAANIINIVGGTGIDTQGVGDQVTINVDVDVATQYTADSGSAVPAANNLDVVGGNVVTTSGATDTLTVELTQGTNGQVILGATGLDPDWATLTSTGGTIAFTPGANTLNLETAVAPFVWNEVTAASDNMDVNEGYIANNAAQVDLTIPTTAAVGDVVRVAGKGAGGWKVSQNAGETIYFGSLSTTTGVGGSLESTVQYDAVELLCIVADTDWVVISSIGNITVT